MRQAKLKKWHYEKRKHKTVICNLCGQEYDISDVEEHRVKCPSDTKNKKFLLPEEGKINLRSVSTHSRSDMERKEIT
jgi:hypothetical protein